MLQVLVNLLLNAISFSPSQGVVRVSSGKGRTTCGYHTWPDGELLYATTEGASEACPRRPSGA